MYNVRTLPKCADIYAAVCSKSTPGGYETSAALRWASPQGSKRPGRSHKVLSRSTNEQIQLKLDALQLRYTVELCNSPNKKSPVLPTPKKSSNGINRAPVSYSKYMTRPTYLEAMRARDNKSKLTASLEARPCRVAGILLTYVIAVRNSPWAAATTFTRRKG